MKRSLIFILLAVSSLSFGASTFEKVFSRVSSYNMRFSYVISQYDVSQYDRAQAVAKMCRFSSDCQGKRALLESPTEILKAFETLTHRSFLYLDNEPTLVMKFDDLELNGIQVRTLTKHYTTVRDLITSPENEAIFFHIYKDIIDPTVDVCCDSRYYLTIYRKDGEVLKLYFDWAD